MEDWPFKVVQVPHAEADDIIGVLSKMTGRHIIVSGDEDFGQLHRHDVNQWSPVQKKMLKYDPVLHLREKIITGDSGDGVPNILSPDDTFVTGQRQSPIRKVKIENWVKSDEPWKFSVDFTEDMKRNYTRNRVLIDLSFTPREMQEAIIVASQVEPKTAGLNRAYDYCRKHSLRYILEHLTEFA